MVWGECCRSASSTPDPSLAWAEVGRPGGLEGKSAPPPFSDWGPYSDPSGLGEVSGLSCFLGSWFQLLAPRCSLLVGTERGISQSPVNPGLAGMLWSSRSVSLGLWGQ